VIKQFVRRRIFNYTIYSDDENIYPAKVITTGAECAKNVSEEQWKFVTKETDRRPKCLPDFNEPSGPTFTLPTCPMPSDFYKKMLPDFLFDHIVKCTNLRAQRHFSNILTKNDKCWREVR
jgi:hypothetical protein